jgi:hypothetical protein
MATLNAKVTLSSSDVASSSINIGVNKSLTINAGGINTIKVVATGTGGTASTIYTADDFAAPAYLYLKNRDTTATDYIYVYDATTAGDPVVLKLAGGDWAFLPLNADKTLKAYATTTGTMLEYGVFGTDA